MVQGMKSLWLVCEFLVILVADSCSSCSLLKFGQNAGAVVASRSQLVHMVRNVQIWQSKILCFL